MEAEAKDDTLNRSHRRQGRPPDQVHSLELESHERGVGRRHEIHGATPLEVQSKHCSDGVVARLGSFGRAPFGLLECASRTCQRKRAGAVCGSLKRENVRRRLRQRPRLVRQRVPEGEQPCLAVARKSRVRSFAGSSSVTNRSPRLCASTLSTPSSLLTQQAIEGIFGNEGQSLTVVTPEQAQSSAALLLDAIL